MIIYLLFKPLNDTENKLKHGYWTIYTVLRLYNDHRLFFIVFVDFILIWDGRE